MDYQRFLNQLTLPSAVLSVEKDAAGLCGDIRVLSSNQAFQSALKNASCDGALYEDLTTINTDFQTLCFQTAFFNEPGHIYMDIPTYGWTELNISPMQLESADCGHCMLTYMHTSGNEIDQLTRVSLPIAEAAIKASITLMETSDFEEGVQQVLRAIVAISGAIVSRVFLLDHKIKHVHMYSSAVSENGEHRKNNRLTYDFISKWEKCIEGKRALVVSTAQDFSNLAKTNPEWVADLKMNDVESLVLIPLRRAGEIYGFVDVIKFDPQKVGAVKELSGIISVFLGSEISNHLLMDQLQEMSTTDALTGLKNRAAMLQRISRIHDTACGIVNLDLNGLKTINDTQGHDAGDRLLVLAAEALKKIYYYEDIHRTGGDEFVVVMPGISRETFDHKLERFLLAMEKNEDVNFAVGSYWTDGSVDLTTAFRLADDAMYADKKAYYERHPEMKQR